MSSTHTRWTVIQRAAEGVPEDQAEFVDLYGPIIRAYLGARWRGTPLFEQVDDASQQVFLDCFRDHGALSRAETGRPTGFRAFLYGIVTNVARMTERKQARGRERQPTSSLDLAEVAADGDSVATVFDREWAKSLLRQAAQLQFDRARDLGPRALLRHRLLTMRYGENLPIREIAARWDIDASVLNREHPKAREEFKSALMDVVRELQGGEPRNVAAECERLLEHFF